MVECKYFNKCYTYSIIRNLIRKHMCMLSPFKILEFRNLKKKFLYEGSRCWSTLWTFKYLAESLILHSTCAYISAKQICAAEFSIKISIDFGLVNLPLAAHIPNKWTNTRKVYDTPIMAIVLNKTKQESEDHAIFQFTI